MKMFKIFTGLVLSMFLVSPAYALWPYTMTYTVSTDDTILADHINTSNNEHINSNIPENIDDYSVSDAEMQSTADPFPSDVISKPTTLDGELQRLRHQIFEIQKALGIGFTYWYEDVIYLLKKNALINADFNIWQRGTSFTTIASAAYSADRVRYSKVGAMVHTVDRVTDFPSVAASFHRSQYSLRVDCTTVDAAIAASDLCIISQRIEGFNFLPLAQQAMTLSFWHKHTKTGIYCVSFRNSNSDRSYVAEYTQAVTDTWEKATINITASPSAGTWDYTTGIGLKVAWVLAAGTDFHGTADTWESANDLSTSNQVNACDNIANNFILAQVKLEQGSVATRFVGEEITTDLNRCKRYYEELNNEGHAGYEYGTGQCKTATTASLVINFIEKRTNPTITDSAAGDFNVTKANGTSEAVTVFSFASITIKTTLGEITTAGNLVAGDATRLNDDTNTNSRIYIDAEL